MEVMNFNKFIKLINKKKELDKMEVNKRRLLEKCSIRRPSEDVLQFISNCSSNIFLETYRELAKSEKEMDTLNDMVLGENLIFHINTCDIDLDMEEEIYWLDI